MSGGDYEPMMTGIPNIANREPCHIIRFFDFARLDEQ